MIKMVKKKKDYINIYGQIVRDTEYYKEYKRLGGKKSRKEYFENLDIFIDETLDIFVYGDTIRHNSREESIVTVSEIANIPIREVIKIFESVDNIDAYT